MARSRYFARSDPLRLSAASAIRSKRTDCSRSSASSALGIARELNDGSRDPEDRLKDVLGHCFAFRGRARGYPSGGRSSRVVPGNWSSRFLRPRFVSWQLTIQLILVFQAALLMNRITLHRHDAIFLAAGKLHAYLRGGGVEIMANSDNVMRGGLTPKFINVDELLKVLDFRPGVPDLVRPTEQAPGIGTMPLRPKSSRSGGWTSTECRLTCPAPRSAESFW